MDRPWRSSEKPECPRFRGLAVYSKTTATPKQRKNARLLQLRGGEGVRRLLRVSIYYHHTPHEIFRHNAPTAKHHPATHIDGYFLAI